MHLAHLAAGIGDRLETRKKNRHGMESFEFVIMLKYDSAKCFCPFLESLGKTGILIMDLYPDVAKPSDGSLDSRYLDAFQ